MNTIQPAHISSARSVIDDLKSVAGEDAEVQRSVDIHTQVSEEQELQQLRQIILTYKDLESEVSVLSAQVREKKKRQKALEEMILRIMKKHNIGALDLKGSGGRILYRRQTSKAGLNPKTLGTLLTQHLKSETAAADAIKFISEHREARVRESILYEKE